MPALRHGMSDTPIHCIWQDMRRRCHSPKHKDWHSYGGRGIKIDPVWDDFIVFFKDTAPWPGKGWTLDRLDENKNYGPTNWRWATRAQQVREHRRTTQLTMADAIAIRASSLTQTKLAHLYGVSISHIGLIINGRRWK